MPIFYNSQKLIPVPSVVISKEYRTAGDGQKIGALFNIEVQGKLVAYKGSPMASGTFFTGSDYPADETVTDDTRLKAILAKQQAIRQLFSEDGHVFEIVPWDGSTPTKCNPTITNIAFAPGLWYNDCDYTISMQAYKLYGAIVPDGEDDFPYFIQEANEEWNIELNEQAEGEGRLQTFRLTHNVSAVGTRFFDTGGQLTQEAWKNARDWVLPRLGLDVDRITASGSLNLPSYFTGFNHARTEAVGELNGNYSVTETWIISSGNALEDFNVSITSGISDGLVRVSIEGNIQGLETRGSSWSNITTSKYSAAQTKFAAIEGSILARAMNYSSVNLNAMPTQKVIRRSPIGGNINYTYEYDTRPSNLVPGALSESIEIRENYPGDIFAAIPVLGRAAGPVLQDLETIGEKSRSLSIQLVMAPSNGTTYAQWYAQKPDVNSIVADVRPTESQTFKQSDTDNWNPKTGIFSREVVWVYQ